jgi:hypothetical protein
MNNGAFLDMALKYDLLGPNHMTREAAFDTGGDKTIAVSSTILPGYEYMARSVERLLVFGVRYAYEVFKTRGLPHDGHKISCYILQTLLMMEYVSVYGMWFPILPLNQAEIG